MKLKKFASMLLAGVMAVSMLAGCQTTSNDQPTQPEQPTTPATGYSAAVQGKLSTIAKVKLTLSDSTELDNALNYAVGFASANKIGTWYVTDGMSFISGNNKSTIGEVTKSVIEAMDANKDGLDAENIGDVKDFLTPDNDKNSGNYKKDDQDIVFTYIINGQTSMNNVLELVAEDISKNVMDDMSVLFNNGVSSPNSEVPYYYTGSVSAKTVELADSHGVSTTFVAVELVRHIGK